LQNKSIQLTSCNQQYNYLYIRDFVFQLLSIVSCKENKSGIYNLCNSESIALKGLLIQIAELMNVSRDLLKFGEIPQRPEQNMLIAGDNKKFINSFTLSHDPIGITKGLQRTIDYHKNNV
jgi:nucleoside-diphosphate-sugar epimerase